jgi:hypothetical protein
MCLCAATVLEIDKSTPRQVCSKLNAQGNNMTISKEDRQQIVRLLKPSFFSGTMAVLAGLTVTLGVLVIFATQNSSVQQQLIAWQTKPAHLTTVNENQYIVENDRPTLSGSWPLLIVWAFVGLGVYVLTMTLVHSVGRAKDLTESMDYVNAKPAWQLEVAVEHFVMRLISTIIFVCLVAVLMKQVVPYSITAAHASALEIATPNGVLYAFLSLAIVVVTVHVQVIFLRLAVGKVRVFNA